MSLEIALVFLSPHTYPNPHHSASTTTITSGTAIIKNHLVYTDPSTTFPFIPETGSSVVDTLRESGMRVGAYCYVKTSMSRDREVSHLNSGVGKALHLCTIRRNIKANHVSLRIGSGTLFSRKLGLLENRKLSHKTSL